MKTFRIGMLEDIGGYTWIQAKTKEEAKKKVRKILEDYGIDGFEGFDMTHREVNITEVEEEK